MQKVIDGFRYDTEKAEEVATYHNGCSRSDFHFVRKGLYRTNKGSWFVAGEGGAMSEYATQCGSNEWGGGENIRPVDADTAKNILEQWDAIGALEEYFGDQLKDA